MRSFITSLLLALSVASVAQNELPAAPTDSVVYRINLAGERLVTSTKRGNLSLGLAIGGAAITGGTAFLLQLARDNAAREGKTVDGRAATYGYVLGGGLFVGSLVLAFDANHYKAKAGRTLRNVRRP